MHTPTVTAEVRIAKVTGALPLTAASFTRDPKIPNWEDYEIRCVVGFEDV